MSEEKESKIQAKKEPIKGQENLIPFDQLAEEEQRRIRSLGGKARQKQMRERKSLKETLLMLMDMEAKDEASIKKMQKNGISENLTNATMVGLALVDKAKAGNIPAQRLLAEMVGENEVQGVTKIPNGSININFVKPDEAGEK